MTKPRIDAAVLDVAPTDDKLTDYDRLHLITYIRLLDADADRVPGRRRRVPYCILTPTQSPSAPDALIKAIWREHSG